MNDICACLGHGCPKKLDCYRFLMKKGYMQSFFISPPYDKVTGLCDYFVDRKSDENRPY